MKKVARRVLIAIIGLVVMGITGIGYAADSLNNPELDRYVSAMKESHNIGMAVETADIKNCSAENKTEVNTLEGFIAALGDPCQTVPTSI